MIVEKRLRKKYRIRKKVMGTQAMPRMTLYKSLRSLYVQVIDDEKGTTLCSAASMGTKGIQAATVLGKRIAEAAKKHSIEKVVLDRNGYRYHGVVKALADSVRENGLKL